MSPPPIERDYAGPELLAFNNGWAVPAIRGSSAHWYQRVDGHLRVACGKFRGRTPLPLFLPGRFHRCIACLRALKKRWGAVDMDGDRVRFAAGRGEIAEGTVVGWVELDHSAHAVVRTDDGKYRSVLALHLRRIDSALEAPAS